MCGWMPSQQYGYYYKYTAHTHTDIHQRSAQRSLITVFPILPETTLNADWLESLLDDVLQADDVFCLEFLSGVVFLGNGILEGNSLDARTRELLSSRGTLWTQYIDAASIDGSLLPGPYVLEKGLLWKVSRLYEDTANAFTVGLRTVSKDGYYYQGPYYSLHRDSNRIISQCNADECSGLGSKASNCGAIASLCSRPAEPTSARSPNHSERNIQHERTEDRAWQSSVYRALSPGTRNISCNSEAP